MARYAAQDAKWSQSCVHAVPNYLNAVPKLYQSRVYVVPNHLKAVPKLTEPEDIPASQVVDDFHERLLPVGGDVVEGLAAFIKVLHLIKKMRMVMMMIAAIMGMMKKMRVLMMMMVAIMGMMKKMRMVMMMTVAIMGRMTIVIVVTFHSIELY